MRKALKTVLCVALVLALAVVIALRVLPPMNAPAQAAAATPTPAAAAAPIHFPGRKYPQTAHAAHCLREKQNTLM